MGRNKKANETRQNAAEVRDLAGSAVETVREHAAAAGESVGSAVTSALDASAARSRRARKKARKQAGSLQDSVQGARRRSARQLRKATAKAADELEKRAAQLDQAPEHRRGRVLAAAIAVAALGAGAAAARSLGGKDPAPHRPSQSG